MIVLLIIIAGALCVAEYVQTKGLFAAIAAIVCLIAAILALGVVKI